MMKLAYDNVKQRGDLVRTAGLNLETDDGLETAVITSLFSDARAREGDGVDPLQDQGGWWGEIYLTPAGPHGSRLYLLKRGKMTNDTLLIAGTYAKEALAWMLDSRLRVASAVTATCVRMTGRNDAGVLSIGIQRAQKLAPRFERKWEVQFGL